MKQMKLQLQRRIILSAAASKMKAPIAFLLLLLLLLCSLTVSASVSGKSSQKYDPCCSFPCQNGGVCVSRGWDDFQCDCTGLDYYGATCQTREFHLLNFQTINK